MIQQAIKSICGEENLTRPNLGMLTESAIKHATSSNQYRFVTLYIIIPVITALSVILFRVVRIKSK